MNGIKRRQNEPQSFANELLAQLKNDRVISEERAQRV